MSLCHTCDNRALRQIGGFAIWGWRARNTVFDCEGGMNKPIKPKTCMAIARENTIKAKNVQMPAR